MDIYRGQKKELRGKENKTSGLSLRFEVGG